MALIGIAAGTGMVIGPTLGGLLTGFGTVVPLYAAALIAAAASQLVAGHSSVASHQRAVRLGHLERRFTLPLTSALTTDVLTVPYDAAQELVDEANREAALRDGQVYVEVYRFDRAMIFEPTAAWIATSNIWRGMTSFSLLTRRWPL